MTGIGQGTPAFHSPYSGPHSLNPNGDLQETFSSTLFIGKKLWEGGEVYFDPEVVQGKGLSDTAGVAGFPNGEGSRAGIMESSLLGRSVFDNNVARLFLRQTINLSDAYENVDSDQNQLAGKQSTSRVVLTFGKMGPADFFDDNLYSHDARTQFMNWGIWANGAWDVPSNAKAYTEGLAIEYIQPLYSLRWGGFLEPAVSNGEALDYRFWKVLGQVLELEKPYTLYTHPGKVRILGFLNRAHMGSYEEAINSPDVDITESRQYRFKYGAGLNIEQEITKDLGSFMRLGWNDGQTETWAYTEIDQTLTLGLSLKGNSWSRPDDTVGLAGLINGLSSEHRRYLEDGGLGFIIGDGKLSYAYEKIAELYYNYHLSQNFSVTVDYQFIADPAYNSDRGPVSVFSLRLHCQF
jgi:high affinity Mn2+ porin